MIRADAGPPVLAVDGPTASGKGTVCRLLAARLGFHLLDSGAIYRAFALAIRRSGDNISEISHLKEKAQVFSLDFRGDRIIVDDIDSTLETRGEEIGLLASRLAAIPEVRSSLLQRQRMFARPPGLVADGRDMGTVVFPWAQLKVFLTATLDERARRRSAQQPEIDAREIVAAIRRRDDQDRNRAIAPLRLAEGAVMVDNAGHQPEETADIIERLWRRLSASN